MREGGVHRTLTKKRNESEDSSKSKGSKKPSRQGPCPLDVPLSIDDDLQVPYNVDPLEKPSRKEVEGEVYRFPVMISHFWIAAMMSWRRGSARQFSTSPIIRSTCMITAKAVF